MYSRRKPYVTLMPGVQQQATVLRSLSQLTKFTLVIHLTRCTGVCCCKAVR